MPLVFRLGDIASEHHGCPPTPSIVASGDVFVNDKGVVRQGDACLPHSSHPRAVAEGSSSVFVNGRPAARIGDAIDCGGEAQTGSADVAFGD